MWWVRNKYGLSCDNLLSAEVVTADGRVVTASADENADLYWGLRGAGGNFTSFEFGLHPLGSEIVVAITMYDLDEAERVLRGWSDFTASAPNEITSGAFIGTVPGDRRVWDPKIGSGHAASLS